MSTKHFQPNVKEKREFDHKRVVKVLAGERITLPKDWLDKHCIKKGDLIAFVDDVDSKMITLVPVIAVPRDNPQHSNLRMTKNG